MLLLIFVTSCKYIAYIFEMAAASIGWRLVTCAQEIPAEKTTKHNVFTILGFTILVCLHCLPPATLNLQLPDRAGTSVDLVAD